MTFYLPTASSVGIYIEGIELDLAFRLDWKETEPRIPIYGYNDREYTKTVSGRRLIQGFLVMNFIAPYYLTSAIMQREINEQKKFRQEGDILLNELLANATTDEEKLSKAKLISAELFRKASNVTAKGTFSPRLAKNKRADLRRRGREATADIFSQVKENNSLKEQLIDSFIRGRDIGLKGGQLPKDTALDYKKPFNMEIYPQDPSFAQWYIVLEDVEITDVSQTINSSGANGSSEPLYETYEFIAKRRTVVNARHQKIK